jgi:hypothetical protein
MAVDRKKYDTRNESGSLIALQKRVSPSDRDHERAGQPRHIGILVA